MSDYNRKKRFFECLCVMAVIIFVGFCQAYAGAPDFGTWSLEVPQIEMAQTGVARIDAFRAHEGTEDWSPDGRWIAYGAKNKAGHFEVHLATPEGGNDVNLTANTPGLPKTHVASPAWHPLQKYLLVMVEKAKHKGSSFLATPGFAGYSDVWLITADGKKSFQLTDLPNDPDHGIMTPKFSPDGRRILWTERIQHPGLLHFFFGRTVIRVADFVDGEQPHIGNIRTFEPEGPSFYEAYGFSPDGSRIIFCSNMRGKSIWDQDIYTIDSGTGKDVKRLTNGAYNEHAIYSRTGKSIVWMTNYKSKKGGTDWWMMDADGGNKHQLTFFNDPKDAEYAGTAVWACFGSFSPDNKRFVADIQVSLLHQTGVIKVVTLAEPAP